MKIQFRRLCISAIIFLQFNTAFSQKAEVTGMVLNISKDMFGYNTNTWNQGPKFDNANFRFVMGRLQPGNLRYPGGTIANYWDWRNGTPMKTASTGWPKYIGDASAFTPEDFVKGIPEGCEVVYDINLARPTPITGITTPNGDATMLSSQETLDKKIVDIMEGIDAFFAAGHSLKYVELGNEFYHGAVGGVDQQGGVYTGNTALYINHANQVAQAIHTKYPDIKIAIIGEYNRNFGYPAEEWTQDLYDAIANGSLNHIDAVTFHWYSSPGTSTLANATDAMNSLGQTFHFTSGRIKHDYNYLPDGLDIWVTEYNTWSKTGEPDNGGAIQGTWVNGIFGASLALQYTLMGDRVKMLNLHELGQGSNDQWHTFENTNTLTANGVALGAIGRAMKGMDKAQKLLFSNIPGLIFDVDKPSLYGGKFWNSETGRESVAIINSTNQAKNNIDISSLFSGNGNKKLYQYSDATPWNKGVNEIAGITFNHNADLGATLNIPAFSITVIMQESMVNLVENGDFENYILNPWVTNAGLEDNIQRVYGGLKAMKLVSETTGWSSCYQKINVEGSTGYVVDAQIQTMLSEGNGRLHIRFFDASENEVGVRVNGTGIGGNKAYLNTKVNFQTPAEATNIELHLQLANGTGTVWFDEVQMYSEGGSSNSIQNKNIHRVVLHSNPCDRYLFIQSKNNVQVNIRGIFDMRGKRMSVQMDHSNNRIDVSDLSKGIYFVSVEVNGQLECHKIMIK